jgi:hypothetical protein
MLDLQPLHQPVSKARIDIDLKRNRYGDQQHMRELAGGCYPPETQRSAPALRPAPQSSRVRISAAARLQSKRGRSFAPEPSAAANRRATAPL